MIETKELDEVEVKKKHRYKRYIKMNIISLFFTAISFISVTLAWFAYSGLVTTQTEVDVKAWFIEFNSKGNAVSNDITISLDDIYPGMETVSENIDIKNLGDSDAMINYKIKSVRILDEVYDLTDLEKVEDELSNKYPFHINFSLSDTLTTAKTGVGNFIVSVSWPLDSGDNEADTSWGMKAYKFQSGELDKYNEDNTYQMRSAIELKVGLEAVQYIGEGSVPDPKYMLGTVILYDVVNNTKCDAVSTSCLKTYVIDENNTLTDTSVKMIPDMTVGYGSGAYASYDTLYATVTSGWAVTNRSLTVSDLLSIVSNDVEYTVMTGDNVSDSIVGYVNYGNRMNEKITTTVSRNGMFKFKTTTFNYLNTEGCYWLADNYNDSNHFALSKDDDTYSKIYGEVNTNSCKVVPVIEVSKINLSN